MSTDKSAQIISLYSKEDTYRCRAGFDLCARNGHCDITIEEAKALHQWLTNLIETSAKAES